MLIRTCLISKKKCKQSDLIQICFQDSGKFIVNENGESFIEGRSIYLQKDKKIITQFLGRPASFLKNFIKKEFSDETFEELKSVIKKIKV